MQFLVLDGCFLIDALTDSVNISVKPLFSKAEHSIYFTAFILRWSFLPSEYVTIGESDAQRKSVLVAEKIKK